MDLFKYDRQKTCTFPITRRVTVLPAKSDSDDKFWLQSYQGLVIDKSLSIRVSSSEVYTIVLFFAIVNQIYVTVTLGWHDSRVLQRYSYYIDILYLQ